MNFKLRKLGFTGSIGRLSLIAMTLICIGSISALGQSPKAGEIRKNAIGVEFVWIPPGEFMMGSKTGETYQKPVHRVAISQGFWMGKYEVTQSQYEALSGINPSRFTGCGSCPVESVTWADAQKFASQLNAANDGYDYSLPSESQWEYAARAGTTGDHYGTLNEIAWYDHNSENKTHPVGQKKPNAFGLFDMSGNVFEWVKDIYNYRGYKGLPADGSANLGIGDSSLRVIRGGAWENDALDSQSSTRGGLLATLNDSSLGFRVVSRRK